MFTWQQRAPERRSLSLLHLFGKSFTVGMALKEEEGGEVCVVKWLSLRGNDFLSPRPLTYFISFSFLPAGILQEVLHLIGLQAQRIIIISQM